MHLDDSELGRERRRTPRGGGAGGDNLISGKKKFVHVEVGTLFTFLFLEGGGSMPRKSVYRRGGGEGAFPAAAKTSVTFGGEPHRRFGTGAGGRGRGQQEGENQAEGDGRAEEFSRSQL